MRIWKQLIGTAALVFCLSAWGHAGSRETQSEEHGGQGYAFFAPGVIVGDGSSLSMAHFGAGGEALIFRGLGVGAEIGYVTPWRDFAAGVGLLSIDGSYHFARAEKISPFITGGYSLGFRGGHVNLVNFGGGLNYWFHNRIGLRLEFRDHMDASNFHYLSGRVGISFR